MFELKALFDSIKWSVVEYQKMINAVQGVKKSPKKYRDYTKIKEFLFKKVF